MDQNGCNIEEKQIKNAYKNIGKFIGKFLPAKITDDEDLKQHKYSSVYTINYDLLLYWILAYCNSLDSESNGVPKFGGIKKDNHPAQRPRASDGFSCSDEDKLIHYAHYKHSIYYLHGMLGICGNNGDIIKIKYSEDSKILEQIKIKIEMVPSEWPLFLLDGGATNKENSIEKGFFKVAYDELKNNLNNSSLLCIFGCSFANDEYLLNCINNSRFRGKIVIIDNNEINRITLTDVTLFHLHPEDFRNKFIDL